MSKLNISSRVAIVASVALAGCGVLSLSPADARGCAPETDREFCTRLGFSCGVAEEFDNCGNARTVPFCGRCADDQTCTSGRCSCVPGAVGCSTDAGDDTPDGGSELSDGGSDSSDGGGDSTDGGGESADGGTECGPCCQDPFAEDCRCTNSADCAGADTSRFDWRCTTAQRCARICQTNGDCQGQPGTVCIDTRCLPPPCMGDIDCIAPDVCRGGACLSPATEADVASCDIFPDHAWQFGAQRGRTHALVRDAQGRVIRYDGAVRWTASNASATTSSTSTVADWTANSTGDLALGASIGSVLCTGSTLHVLDSTFAGYRRVTVVAAPENVPVPDALVTFSATGASIATSTGGEAVASAAMSVAAEDITITHPDFASLVLLASTSTDLLVRLEARNRELASCLVTTRTFDELPDVLGTVHSASIEQPRSDGVLGRFPWGLFGAPSNVVVDTGNQRVELPIGSGAAFGVGELMSKPRIETRPSAGRHGVSAVLGNMTILRYGQSLGPILNGDSYEPWQVYAEMSDIQEGLGRGGLAMHPVESSGSATDLTRALELGRNPWHTRQVELPARPEGDFQFTYVETGQFSPSGAFLEMGLSSLMFGRMKIAAPIEGLEAFPVVNIVAASTGPASFARVYRGMPAFEAPAGGDALSVFIDRDGGAGALLLASRSFPAPLRVEKAGSTLTLSEGGSYAFIRVVVGDVVPEAVIYAPAGTTSIELPAAAVTRTIIVQAIHTDERTYAQAFEATRGGMLTLPDAVTAFAATAVR
jgi:hypothetical protein